MTKKQFELKIRELLSSDNLFSGAIIKIDYKHKGNKNRSYTKEMIIKSK
jgi:hypothetical protein